MPACPDASCGQCPTGTVFGYTLTPTPEGRTGRRGRIAVRDAIFASGIEDVRPHVAIDRVTGGARDSALFTEEVVVAGTVTIEVLALEDVPPWAAGLLWAALIDVDEGYVGFGHATTRGQGTLHSAGRPLADDQWAGACAALDLLRPPKAAADLEVTA